MLQLAFVVGSATLPPFSIRGVELIALGAVDTGKLLLAEMLSVKLTEDAVT